GAVPGQAGLGQAQHPCAQPPGLLDGGDGGGHRLGERRRQRRLADGDPDAHAGCTCSRTSTPWRRRRSNRGPNGTDRSLGTTPRAASSPRQIMAATTAGGQVVDAMPPPKPSPSTARVTQSTTAVPDGP